MYDYDIIWIISKLFMYNWRNIGDDKIIFFLKIKMYVINIEYCTQMMLFLLIATAA